MAIAIIAILAKESDRSTVSAAEQAQFEKARSDSAAATSRRSCEEKKTLAVADFEKLMVAGKPGDAAAALGNCPAILQDTALVERQRAARAKGWELVYRDGKRSPVDRLAAVEAALGADPAASASFADLKRQLEPKAKAWRVAEEARLQREEIQRRKREGVSIGMTQERVLQSSWGRPSKVNRTTTARVSHEQWVYEGGGGYLYFDNGILTAIQN